jgi:four helix bundle protein
MENSMNEQFRNRTKTLAISIVKMYGSWRKCDEIYIMGKQLLRCSTSVAANYRAVCRARSEKERYAKMCIVVEEADETLFWLELLGESELVPIMSLEKIYSEAEEILKVMASYKSKLENKLK